MKKRLLDLLKCPKCGGNFKLEVRESHPLCYSADEEKRARKYCSKKKIPFSSFTEEVIEGTLLCKCRSYVINGGIPRFSSSFGDSASSTMQSKTREGFGFQWKAFGGMHPQYKQNFLNYLGEVKPSFFKNKIVLDAGCGMGRHSFYSCEFGAETVAFDLSDAVESAQKNLNHFPLSHVVQGDIYNLPFKKKFGFIYCIGVLQHMPFPEQGFRKLVELMNKKTLLFVWVYASEGRFFKTQVVEILHSFTKHLPHNVLYCLCLVPASVYHFFNLLYLNLRKVGLNDMAEKLPFKNYAAFPFGVKHADAFDLLSTQVNNYYTRDEFLKWFTDVGLIGVEVTSFGGKSWRGFARKPEQAGEKNNG